MCGGPAESEWVRVRCAPRLKAYSRITTQLNDECMQLSPAHREASTEWGGKKQRPTKSLYCNSSPFAVLQLRMQADRHSAEHTTWMQQSREWLTGWLPIIVMDAFYGLLLLLFSKNSYLLLVFIRVRVRLDFENAPHRGPFRTCTRFKFSAWYSLRFCHLWSLFVLALSTNAPNAKCLTESQRVCTIYAFRTC